MESNFGSMVLLLVYTCSGKNQWAPKYERINNINPKMYKISNQRGSYILVQAEGEKKKKMHKIVLNSGYTKRMKKMGDKQ